MGTFRLLGVNCSDGVGKRAEIKREIVEMDSWAN